MEDRCRWLLAATIHRPLARYCCDTIDSKRTRTGRLTVAGGVNGGWLFGLGSSEAISLRAADDGGCTCQRRGGHCLLTDPRRRERCASDRGSATRAGSSNDDDSWRRFDRERAITDDVAADGGRSQLDAEHDRVAGRRRFIVRRRIAVDRRRRSGDHRRLAVGRRRRHVARQRQRHSGRHRVRQDADAVECAYCISRVS